MKVGDLVQFSPGLQVVGSLASVKYFARISNQVKNRAWLVIQINGASCVVGFGEKTIVLYKNHLEVLNESR